MNKNLSYKWAFAVALFFPVLQIVIFYFRFQRMNAEASFTDYLAFFISGLLIGLALIYLLRRSETTSASRCTIIGFIIGIPLALVGMMVGGLTGAFGAVLFSISPSIFVMLIGYVIGRARGQKK
jgi:hypothetical protein